MAWRFATGMREVGVLLAVGALSCSRQPPAEQHTTVANDSHEGVVEVQRCAFPSEPPKGATLSVSRTVVPHGADVRVEEGVLAATAATCVGKKYCAVVGAARFGALWRAARSLQGLRSSGAKASPHYGSRDVSVEWPGGRCSFSDGSLAPLAERDRKRFYAFYDRGVALVVDAGAGEPSDAGRP